MPNRILHAVFFTLVCLTIGPLAQGASAKRNITERDLFDFVWIGSPQISPDGAHIAFSVNGDSGIALWVADVATGRSRRLTEARGEDG